MNDTDRVTSDHLLHSTPATFDIDAAFAAQLRDWRASEFDACADALCAAAAEVGVAAEWTPAHTPTDAEYERMSAGKSDGIVEHDDWQAGMWK